MLICVYLSYHLTVQKEAKVDGHRITDDQAALTIQKGISFSDNDSNY